MKQINLKTEGLTGRQVVEKKAGTLSIVLGLIVLLVSSSIYGALLFYTKQVESEITASQQAQAEKKQQLDIDQFKQMYGFEDKLNSLKERLAQRPDALAKLERIASYTLAEANVETVSIDSENIAVTMTLPDYDTLSRQIKNYNSIEGLISFEPSVSKAADTNLISASMNIKL